MKVRLQELVSTLEHVTRNAEARLLEGREIVHDLNHTNRYVRISNLFSHVRELVMFENSKQVRLKSI